MTNLAAQIIGIVAMLFNILSFQCKKNKHLMLMLGAGSVLFSLNYILIGAYAGAGFNLINILRSIFVVNKKTHNNKMFVSVCVLYMLTAAVTFENLWTLILLSSQFVATYVMWYKDGAVIRKLQTFYVSPIWLINNIFVSFTIGGIICEVFVIASALISFVRYGKNGFEV